MTTGHLDCNAAAADARLTTSRLEQLGQVAREAANLGGSVLMRHYGRLVSIQQKARAGDLVTDADLAAEKAVLASNFSLPRLCFTMPLQCSLPLMLLPPSIVLVLCSRTQASHLRQ